MRHRLLLLAAAAAAVAVPLAIEDGPRTKRANGATASASASPAPHPARRRYTYAAARRKGQPVAVLTRPAVLRAAPGGHALGTVRRRTEWGTPTVLAALAERRGWLRVMATELPNGGSGWIPASAAGVVPSRWKLVADLSSRLVTVRRDGRVVRRFRVAVGRPSTPTPTGRFAITDKLHFTDRSRVYGWGAI